MRSELLFESGSDARPGILVHPEAYGLNAHAFERAHRLASLGYVALACDSHGVALVAEELGQAIKMLEPLYADPSKPGPSDA